jgi:hypothetical protein
MHHRVALVVLAGQARVSKTMTLITLGPYEEPSPVWMPSIAY